MMVSYYNQGVPTTVDLENNSNQKKYTINRSSGTRLVISKPLCVLMAIGALLLAVLVGLIVFFLVPRYCNAEESPEALVKNQASEATPIAIINEDDDVDERLPRSIEPTHYRDSSSKFDRSIVIHSTVSVTAPITKKMIKIQPNFQNSTTSGAETITLKPIENTNIIIFHVNNITINKHSVVVKSTKLDSKPIEINDQDYIQGQKYRIHLNEHLKTGEEYQLDMKFDGELNRHLQGFYRSQYNDRSGNERYAASTQFSPTDARRAFPCFDEPSFKAKFTISLARPSNMTTLSNMPLNSSALSVEQNETYYWDHYPETPKMSTYLVAFIVSNLKPLAINSNGIIKIWAREEFLPYARYAAEIAPQILDYFERYFGIPYPLPKMDIVAVPEFGFSAMENWGLITFRESSLLFDPRSSTTEDMRTIANVLSHEIAHQWFGNLVTPKWWNDLWLKEGFASYLQYFGVNYTEPMWKITDEFIATETQKAMSIDALESSRPISFEVKNSRQIRQAFDEISYSKGAAIIRMMNHFLGEEVFRRGLINYLQKHQNGNADRQDLFTSLTMEAHKADVLLQNDTVKHIMDTWTERAGFPLVTAAADYENKRLHITQRRFYLNDKEERSSWWVPLSFTTSREENFEDTRPKFWLRGQYETVESAELGEWYLLNLNQTGYFIVNYDEKNWRALINHIMDFPPIIRAQLISDSMELARANVLDYDIPLRMIARMAVRDGDIMFVPTLIAFKKLKFLSDILSQTPAFGHFEEYHRAIFKMTYQKVTFDDIVDDYITRRIRQTVLEWSCMSPDSTCVHQSRSKFRQLMINHYDVEPNLRGTVYCTAIREGSELEWEFAYEKYLETQSPSEKNMLLDALGCTKLSWLLSRYVKKLLDDSSIRIQDADRVFESVAKNRVGTQIAFDFLRKNWDELLNHYGDGFNILAKMIKALAPHMNTEFQLLELERFKNSVKTNISTTAIAFESAIETVKSNVDWMKKNYNQVEKWFIENKDRFVYL